jgi:hypothetical protein
MDETEFWALIDRAREEADADPDGQAVALYGLLKGRAESELQAFATMLETFRARAYRWDLWEAGTLANDGMGDDLFDDFRAWLISRGRIVYEQTLANPDYLADLPEVQRGDDLAAESFPGAVYDAYHDTYGRELEAYSTVPRSTDVGTAAEYSDEELRRRFPRLYALKSS